MCRLMVDWVDCRCFLSFVFLGGARRLGLSPCNTETATHAWHLEGKSTTKPGTTTANPIRTFKAPRVKRTQPGRSFHFHFHSDSRELAVCRVTASFVLDYLQGMVISIGPGPPHCDMVSCSFLLHPSLFVLVRIPGCSWDQAYSLFSV